MSRPLRVLLVDDSSFVRRASERMLTPATDIEVVGTAANGREAVERVHELKPDVVVMDVNMPEMSGLEALEHIMRERPTPVLLMSTTTKEGADVTLRGLELGAVDFLDKGSVGAMINLYDLAPVLREKIRGVAAIDVSRALARTESAAAGRADKLSCAECDVIGIGASTGGPRALSALIEELPADLDAGIVIAQHMPDGFTETFAERLDRKCPLRVRQAKDGDQIVAGTVLVAPGRRDATVEKGAGDNLRIRISDLRDDRGSHPSVDLLFTSLARAAGSRAVGVIITGMGEDGAVGLRAIREAGGRTIAESEATAVIYGMPRAAAEFADQVLDLPDIAAALGQLARSPQGSGGIS